MSRANRHLTSDTRVTSNVPNGYGPSRSTGVNLPDDFAVTPLQYVV
jgi:hypothetical protein